ncbi:MAG: Transcriptional regulator, TraR/DksA family [Parcubacteria group bacterium GW2011_GWC2_32_10]|nr:MAG: Transcriptional regulator, TraR/DksA family [Parcubacteria group bacterium GW2011_GWC2_32_10]
MRIPRAQAIRNLKFTLIRRRDALRSALAKDMDLLQEPRNNGVGNVVDIAIDVTQDDISSQLAEVESRELTNIETALERIRDGNYGNCEQCEEAIPLARLQTLPYVTLCIGCQREAEKNDSRRRLPDWRFVGEEDVL